MIHNKPEGLDLAKDAIRSLRDNFATIPKDINSAAGKTADTLRQDPPFQATAGEFKDPKPMSKIFVSYSHKQGDWVWDRLVPCLKAGNVEVLIDRERFEAGKAVLGQMDSIQDQAEKHLLILSPDYLASDYCMHELNRAVDGDPDFASGTVIPVIVAESDLPELVKRALHVDLRTETEDAWDLLQSACGFDLGVGHVKGCQGPFWQNGLRRG